MEDSEMRQMVIAAVNECEDIELLDLIYRILASEARNGGEVNPAAFCCYFALITMLCSNSLFAHLRIAVCPLLADFLVPPYAIFTVC